MTRITNLGASTPLLEGGKSLRIPLNLTRYGKRRKPGLQHAGYPCSPGFRRSPPLEG